MELLERYVKQIERYLPYKDRKDTIEELRNLILDQVDSLLEEGYKKDDALYQVIKDMGEPRIVAGNYSNNRSMISKEMEPILELVLKIVSVTLPLVVLFAKMIEFLVGNPSPTFMELILNIIYNIPSAIYSLFVGVGILFMFFYLIEKFIQPQFSIEEKEFDPELLPDIPIKAFKVSIFGNIIGILAIVLVVYLFNLNQGLIAVYYNGSRYPLLNENFDRILIYMNIGWFANILLYVFHSIKRRKNLTSKTIEAILEIYGAIILFLLVTGNIFNNVIIEGHNLNIVPQILKYVGIFLGIAIIIGTIVEYIKLYINLEHLENLEKKAE